MRKFSLCFFFVFFMSNQRTFLLVMWRGEEVGGVGRLTMKGLYSAKMESFWFRADGRADGQAGLGLGLASRGGAGSLVWTSESLARFHAV